MIKVRSTWHLPAGADPAAVEAAYFETRLPSVRRLPGLRRHVLHRALPDARGGNPPWWRGDELWFDSVADLDAAVASPEWAAIVADGFTTLTAGTSSDVFEVEEEFAPPGAPDGTAEVTALSGRWQVPTHLTPPEVDPVYHGAHVPNVRRLPRLQRHTVMRAIPWPEGTHPRYWRSAEIRFATKEDFDAAFVSPEYDAMRVDGFTASVAGPDVDVFRVEEEWTPAAATPRA